VAWPSRAVACPGRSVELARLTRSTVHGSAQILYQNEEGIKGKLTLGSSMTLLSRARLAAVAPFLQAFEMVHDPSKASPTVIPHSEIEGTKPTYVCPGCFIHTYSNNMINRFHVQ
jgi:hypothetical protein